MTAPAVSAVIGPSVSPTRSLGGRRGEPTAGVGPGPAASSPVGRENRDMSHNFYHVCGNPCLGLSRLRVGPGREPA